MHHPSSPPSIKALSILRASVSGPFPTDKPSAPPLELNLEVIEARPTTDQMKTIMSYLPSKAASPSLVFLSAHPSSIERPDTVSWIVELGLKNSNALKWPIVIDWNDGKASVEDVEGVKGILEILRKKRDGELKDDNVDQPKGWFT